ncbi:MAG: hypothetical protein ACP5F9_02565 [Thiomonas sp.]
MPLFVGVVTGTLAPWVWGRGCGSPAMRRASAAGLIAWLVHLVLVGSSLVREGSLLDYAAVLLACSLAIAWSCGRVEKSP